MASSDAILSHLPAERPAAFDALSDAEQAWRGRVFLMTWCIGGTVPFCWDIALNDEPIHNAELQETVGDSDDDAILAAVATRRRHEVDARWEGMLEASRREPGPSRVTMLVPSPRPKAAPSRDDTSRT